jgi:hypothetical protein
MRALGCEAITLKGALIGSRFPEGDPGPSIQLTRDLIASWAAQGGRALAAKVLAFGAKGAFVVSGREGTSDPAADVDVPERTLGLPEMPMMAAIRAAEAALRALPPDVQAAIDAWDPDRRAMALGAIFSDGRDIGGRRFFGARPLAWQALEDKTTIDTIWDAVGVPRAPSVVVPVAEARAAAAKLDQGHGTVWAADLSRGFHGGVHIGCVGLIPNGQRHLLGLSLYLGVISAQLFLGCGFVVVRQVAQEKERQHVVAKVVCVHRAAQLVGNGPQRLAQLFLVLFDHGVLGVSCCGSCISLRAPIKRFSRSISAISSASEGRTR